jgi:hypothetical protein
MPFAAQGYSEMAVVLGLPALMLLSAGVYLAGAFYMLRFPAGGIGEVVRASQSEFEIVAASGG